MKGITEVVFYFAFSLVKEGSKKDLKKERKPIANRQLLYQLSLLPHFLPHGATVTPTTPYPSKTGSDCDEDAFHTPSGYLFRGWGLTPLQEGSSQRILSLTVRTIQW